MSRTNQAEGPRGNAGLPRREPDTPRSHHRMRRQHLTRATLLASLVVTAACGDIEYEPEPEGTTAAGTTGDGETTDAPDESSTGAAGVCEIVRVLESLDACADECDGACFEESHGLGVCLDCPCLPDHVSACLGGDDADNTSCHEYCANLGAGYACAYSAVGDCAEEIAIPSGVTQCDEPVEAGATWRCLCGPVDPTLACEGGAR